MIPHSRPDLGPDEEAALRRLLATGMVSGGAEEQAFERALAAFLGGTVRLTASGTAGLVLALELLGLPAGAEVIVPSYACFAVADAVQRAGAVAVPCDNSDGWVLGRQDVEARLGPRTAAIIAVHTFGICCDVESLAGLCLPIIEDCCQAFGHTTAGARPGEAGELAVGSFHATKCLTTGDGGAVWSRHARWAERLDAERSRAPSPIAIGELGAAIGRVQLARWASFAARRRLIAQRYREALADDEAIADLSAQWHRTTLFRFPLRCRAGFEPVMAHLAARGITARRGVDALIHRRLGWLDHDFPGCLERYHTTVSVPLYPALSDEDVDRICDALATLPGRG